VVAVVNLGTVTIAGFESECPVTGVDGAGRGPAGSRAEPDDDDADGDVVHLRPDREVPNGSRVSRSKRIVLQPTRSSAVCQDLGASG